MDTNRVYTIGHSNRLLDDFLRLLEQNAIRHLIDVRKLPGSARYPQFNAKVLQEQSCAHGIEYLRIEGLTGRRPVSRSVAFEVNAWWQNRSFHNYADYALSDEFCQALEQLRTLSAENRTAIMCSEAVWWRCHRRIIADYLLASGLSVFHILSAADPGAATLSAGAALQPDGSIFYPLVGVQ